MCFKALQWIPTFSNIYFTLRKGDFSIVLEWLKFYFFYYFSISNQNIGDTKALKVFKVNDAIRIVFIGKTGVGKNVTGNSIIGKDVFKSKGFGDSVTQICEMTEAIRGDKKIIVVDTPGLFDNKQDIENTRVEVEKCFVISAPGVYCF